MIKVLFFAQTRELVGIDALELDDQFNNVEAIRAHLVEIGEGTEGTEGKWDLALEPGKLLAAVNQSIVPLDTEVKEGDEVAFFPPVTGG
ncbi:molybdopterin synthase sulfur carrier subunit [Vibrio harveyi]|jgi:molybdopterin synthase sulfur carrier subunit|uniref:molybdopterin synthase sulfur carrier subunit n=1 Tax=Vibrio harveyi TaxID=669 RepID=UPI00247FC37F|nr:molybdopterin synthase sulfur carrier subunit [Vibrio harveyi]